MHVDVDQRRVDLEIEHEGRVAVVVHHVTVGLAHRVRDQAVAHHAPVHEEVLQVGLAARERRLRDPAAQQQPGGLDLERERTLQEGRPAQGGDALLLLGGRGAGAQGEGGLLVVAQREAGVEAPQRQPAHDFLAVAVLGALGTQELAPRRGIEEQVVHLDRRAARVRGGRDARLAAGGELQPAAVRRIRGGGADAQARDRGDARQRLAAKAEAEHLLEVLERADLAGGVARDGQRQVVGRDALAVVADADEAHAAVLEIDLDAAGAGVEAVLDQFLDHGRRPFHDLAGRDLVGERVAELLDAPHAGSTAMSGRARKRMIRSAGSRWSVPPGCRFHRPTRWS